MSKLIITTVGTSVITNKLYDSRFTAQVTELVDRETIPRHYNEIVDTAVTNILNNLKNNRPNKDLSAELASLRAFKKALGIAEDDVIALFSTDTEDGKFCAEVNKKVLDELQWCQVQSTSPIVIKALKTKRIKEGEDISQSFRDAGLINLKEETEKLLGGSTYTQKYFNITGGFKATIPFITILAFEKGMSLFYLYEESNDLIVVDPPQEFNCSFDATRNGIRIRRETLAL